MNSKSILVLALWVIMSVSSLAWAVTIETREYLLGDVDGFNYNGSGSIDDVYVDSDWLAWVEWYGLNFPNPEFVLEGITGFDIFGKEHFIPFSFAYNLSSGEQVISASLTIAMMADNDFVSTDEPVITILAGEEIQMEKEAEIEVLDIKGEFTVCLQCGYDGGFHSIFPYYNVSS